MSGYSSQAATVLTARLRGIGELARCREEIMGYERGRWCGGMRMVANVLPLGCPLPQCQGRTRDPHPSQTVDRAPAAPYWWSRRIHCTGSPKDSVQLVIAALSRSVTPCTYRYYCYSVCMTGALVRAGLRTAVGLPAVDSVQDLLAADRAHVWHPYGSMPGRVDPLVVRSAAGVRLQLADGTELVDGMSSWWSAIHGYAHPVLDAAVRVQLGRMSHVMFGGLTHEPAVRLARRLVEITPEPLQHVFFTDSGSVSVEVAIKMCLQYWRSLRQPGKHRLLTWRGGHPRDP